MKKGSRIVKSAWYWFSRYVKLTECMETTGSYEQGICCTCKTLFPYYSLDAGHFIPNRSNSILFHIDLVHIQCKICNRENSGEYDKYKLYMIDRYGEEKVEMLERLKFSTLKLYETDYRNIRDRYKKKVLGMTDGR